MARRERGMERESSLMFREITPPHGWKQDPENHYLRLTLPGFEAKDISIRMDKYGRLVVRGDKQVSQHKYMSFEETYDVPSDANLEDAHAMFEDGQIYCVTIPKLTKEQQQQQHAITIPQNPNQNQNQNQSNINHPNPTQEKPVSSRDYLKLIRGDRSSAKKVALFVALLIALLVLLVFLIIKFRRR